MHGIPGSRKLKEGYIVTLDLALQFEGYCADTAITLPVGTVSERDAKLVRVTRETLELALRLIKPGVRWSEIARQMQNMVESNGFEVRFQQSHNVYDGRFANNGWLQETPDIMTKLVWDNAA